MVKSMSVVTALLVLAAFSATAPATTEYISNSSFNTVDAGAYYGSPIAHASPWAGSSAILVYPDTGGLWYAYSNFVSGQDIQVAQQVTSVTPSNTHYTFSADVEAWTDGTPGIWTAAEIRLYFYNSSVGAGWLVLPESIVGYTNSTSAIAWQHISTTFDLPASFNPGTMPCVALWGHTNGTPAQAGIAFDNVSLQGTPIPAEQPPVPEPLTFLGVLVGLGGLGRYVRRRIAA